MAVAMLRQHERFSLPHSYKRVVLVVIVVTSGLGLIGLVASHSIAPVVMLLWIVPYWLMVGRYQRGLNAAAERAERLNPAVSFEGVR
jgi:hypothetical protein